MRRPRGPSPAWRCKLENSVLAMKLAFQAFGGENWLGGITAFRDLLLALRRLGADAPSTWLVVWEGVPDDDYRAYLSFVDGKIAVPYRPAPAAGRRQRLMQNWRRRLGLDSGRQPSATLAGKLSAQGVDCVFSVVLGNGQHDPTVPLIVWIYDFQYQHLPEFFTPGERQQRHTAFLHESERATLLLAQSDSVKADVARFLPQYADRARRLRWVADIPASIYNQPLNLIQQTYHLPEKFFFLPNQFWMHKNHLTVFKALRRLREQGLRPVVVCSGSLVDSRRPDYINELARTLAVWDLREQVILLGVVPHDHLLMLMRQSISVINASLFEGFGMSVAECISLGKGMLLSDLPVLREQTPPASRYFDPQDEASLADALAAIWNTTAPGPACELEAAARAALPQRQIDFARGFMQLANEAVAVSGRSAAVAEARPR